MAEVRAGDAASAGGQVSVLGVIPYSMQVSIAVRVLLKHKLLYSFTFTIYIGVQCIAVI